MSDSFLAAATMRHLDAIGAIEPAVMRARSSVFGRGASKYNEETMASWKDLGIDAQAAVESKDWETAATLMESCVQRRPDWHKGYLSYMFVLGKLARWDEAERVAHAGIRCCPDPEASQKVSQALETLQRERAAVEADASLHDMESSLIQLGFTSCGGGVWVHPLQGVTMTLPNGTGAPDVEVDGIDQSTTSAFVRLALASGEQPHALPSRLMEWAMAQRQAEAPGIVVLPESARVPRHIAAAGLPSAQEIGANPSRAVRIYTWGLRVIKEGQLPAGAEDSQHTYDASVLTARKHGVTGRSQLAHMNGLDPTLQAILMEDDLFLAWLRGLITNVEAKGHRAISVVCAHGQHRSVAAAEILKTLYYPLAEVVHLTMRRV